MLKTSFVLLWSSVILGCTTSSQDEKPTSESATAAEAEHDSPEAPGHANMLPGLAYGVCQSPIDIRTTSISEGTHTMEVEFAVSRERVVNKGHTVEVDFDPGSSITFDGRTHELAQLHFHTPSEHRVDGAAAPMEMHVVHVEPRAQGADGPPNYLVVGVLFTEGEKNEFLEGFLNDVPPEAHAENMPIDKAISLRELWPGGLPPYWAYRGSLTTPPFSETVQWIVLQPRVVASTAQIERLHALEGDNAREVQDRHQRPVDGT